MRVQLKEIRKAVGGIIEKFRPEKIILFGSYAYGHPTRDSDVDLLVVMRSRKRRAALSSEIWKALWPAAFPLDIVVRSPGDLSRRLKLGDFFIEEIMRKGRVLYAK